MTRAEATARFVEDTAGEYVLVTRVRAGVESVEAVHVGPRPAALVHLRGRFDPCAVRVSERA